MKCDDWVDHVWLGLGLWVQLLFSGNDTVVVVCSLLSALQLGNVLQRSVCVADFAKELNVLCMVVV